MDDYDRRHWHAYAYTGPVYMDGEIMAGKVPEGYPPLEAGAWLLLPAEYVVETFADPGPAVAWLRDELEVTPPVGSSLDVGHMGLYAEWILERTPGRDVVATYFTEGARLASRVLVACPQRELWEDEARTPCPEPAQ